MKINTALILCAGLGERLKPLTLTTPKPLLELKKITILERCIDLIIELGIKKILLNTFHLENQIIEFIENKKFQIDIQIIKDGGWHFAYLHTAQNISRKIKSFAHGEFNKKNLTDEKEIQKRIENKEDIFNRGYDLKKIDIDETYPDYIRQNLELLKNWII